MHYCMQYQIKIVQSTTMQPQIETSHTNWSITSRIFDFIDLHPAHIKHISYSTQSRTLYVARTTYSQVYHVVTHAQDKDKQLLSQRVELQQAMVMGPCQGLWQIGGYIVMVMGLELKVSKDGRWHRYPFTTQILPSSTMFKQSNNKLYTFHVGECRQWSISEQDGVNIRYLSKYDTPYHINAEGSLQGYGKKVKPDGYPSNKFTTVQQDKSGQYLFVGTQKGQIHIYETKYLTSVKSYHRHEGAILAIKSVNNICYFTGSDSKISSLTYIPDQNGTTTGQWVLSKQVRGQSHDIFAIEHIHTEQGSLLVSGGITTDLCLYQLHADIPTHNFVHKVSYSSQKLTQYSHPYLVVNKHRSFQIWKIDDNYKQNVQLLVKYEVAHYKHIAQIISKTGTYQGAILVFVRMEDQAVLWSFDQESGLVKLLTVKNQYDIVQWYKKDCIITIRQGNKLELLNIKTGNIRQIATIDVQFPTGLSVNHKHSKVLISSKYSLQAQMYELAKQDNVKRSLKLNLQHPFNILQFCQTNPHNILLKLCTDKQVNQIDKKGNKVSTVIELPIARVRDCGWLHFSTKSKKKIYWYIVGDSKIIVVSKMKTTSTKRKIRIKQMGRIGNVVVNDCSIQGGKTWDFGVIPLNFTKMITQQVMPILTKKIL